ncbi:MAG: 4Fe-4S binding protein [Lachnospiraceae bacterium]|nr:4Fe-4S binding protein [Lachnospiraceae bacterium]
MNMKQVTGIYFSPTGHSKKVVRVIVSRLGGNTEYLDLTDAGKRPDYHFHENEVVVVGAPVYGGRLPQTAVERFRKLHGNQTPAVLVVTYGNRDYDDALLELKDVLVEQGFRPLTAAAVVAEHNVIPSFASARPDGADVKRLQHFADKTARKMKLVSCNYVLKDLTVKGKRPYKEYHGVPLKIKVSSSCDNCGTCIRKCPVQAISRTDSRVMDEERCISCMRCIHVCPVHGRSISRLLLLVVKQKLKKDCSGRKEPDFFYK